MLQSTAAVSSKFNTQSRQHTNYIASSTLSDRGRDIGQGRFYIGLLIALPDPDKSIFVADL